MPDAKDYAELMKNMKDYCDDNINSKTKSILALIEFKKDKDLSIYVNDVKISQFVMNEIHTTNWTNAEKVDFVAKTRSVIASFKQEDDEEEIYANGNNFIEILEKIVVYCNENSNVKTQSMVTFIETSIDFFKEDTTTLMVKRSLFKNYQLLYYLVIDKMDLDNWTDEEIMDLYVNTIETIPELSDICDGMRIM
jgi:hypothetical protein